MNSLVIYFVGSLLRILQFMFFARAIMSWFVQGSDSKIYEFLCLVTEPVIQPFRSLLSRVSALRNCPFDFAFMLAFFVLIVLEQMVYMLQACRTNGAAFGRAQPDHFSVSVRQMI